jgi:hypothetical protein
MAQNNASKAPFECVRLVCQEENIILPEFPPGLVDLCGIVQEQVETRQV